MSGIREAFEAWASSHFVDVGSGNPLKKGPNGHYGFYVVATAWKAWQASRAALKVELPAEVYPHEVDHKTDLPLYQAGAVADVLQQAGIEVK
ncbi:hypothetical protein [Pseudomonas multiresinivorans]|uniref:Uncharacterized protein n=1 Tax=Pseudomonas multiresinivorans TaxID=95301 RepID=A0A7Z3BGA0_9PSED|nr:hypothetical protein [Pseudomonas multiresinivorans]QJP06317.1 hypothetical protein G4G71_10880 [Pseudomonas multiresinivorans]QJP06325.1 hypothetical protein G4G71_22400 [Pseudomonas multiresinivorans]